jgi:hypothetical protein
LRTEAQPLGPDRVSRGDRLLLTLA